MMVFVVNGASAGLPGGKVRISGQDPKVSLSAESTARYSCLHSQCHLKGSSLHGRCL